MSVADIGAGTGLFEPLFSAAVGPLGRVYAVDISPRFVDHLRMRARREELGNVDVVLGGERATKLPVGSVDVAFICDTYHHFEYPRSSLADLYDVIRPGGILVVVDFERIPGVTADWILGHVRAGKDTFRSEIETAGFELEGEVDVPGLVDNYMLRFIRP
jgi:ubiquinone/menaquinone biosynthesis C-methylase UbiE